MGHKIEADKEDQFLVEELFGNDRYEEHQLDSEGKFNGGSQFNKEKEFSVEGKLDLEDKCGNKGQIGRELVLRPPDPKDTDCQCVLFSRQRRLT